MKTYGVKLSAWDFKALIRALTAAIELGAVERVAGNRLLKALIAAEPQQPKKPVLI